MNLELSDEHTAVQQLAAKFADRRLIPNATEWDRAESAAPAVIPEQYGGSGYTDEFPVGKLLRDARVMTLYEGAGQIQKLLIGRALTGENAF